MGSRNLSSTDFSKTAERASKTLLNVPCAASRKLKSNGAKRTPRLWARANGVNKDIAVKTANFIAGVANEFKVDVIVMEHLDLAGRKRGSKRQRLHHWRAKSVQKMVELKAHRCGIRIRRVCAWNTSKLAFDGTGVVTRDTNNYSMCTFQTGKRYSCDLSASYNIGARYFLREYEKSISVTKWRRISAKFRDVPRGSHAPGHSNSGLRGAAFHVNADF